MWTLGKIGVLEMMTVKQADIKYTFKFHVNDKIMLGFWILTMPLLLD